MLVVGTQSHSIKMQLNYTRSDIQILPDSWKLLPVGGSKTPVDPLTGRPLKEWPKANYSKDAICELDSIHVKAVGVLTGPVSELLSVDFDAPVAESTFLNHFGKSWNDLPSTIMNTSGKEGSFKLFFHVPSDYDGKFSSRHLDKLDILWSGKQAVILGFHPTTGSYKWVEGHSPSEIPLANAPQWLLDGLVGTIKVPPKVAPTTDTDPGIIDVNWDSPRLGSADSIAEAKDWLGYLPPSDYESYNKWLRIGMSLHAVGEDLLAVWIDWSSSMSNFDEAECQQKWKSFRSPEAYRKYAGKTPIGLDTLKKHAKSYQKAEQKRLEEFKKNLASSSTRIPTLLDFLRQLDLRYDDMKRRVVIDGELMSEDPRNYYIELSVRIGEAIQRDLAKDCLLRVAKERAFNPIREYLSSVLSLAATTPSITDDELADWFGLEKNDAVSIELVRVHLRGCALRGMNPGNKLDSMLIMAGNGGLGKSSVIKELAPHRIYFDEITRIDIDNRDTLSTMNSAFIFEIGEAEQLILSRESSAIKAWITRQFDNYVEKYESVVTEHARRCCLFGTTNQTTFLKDPTGSRRFWIIYVKNPCNAKGLADNRDRVWAHSLNEAQDGLPSYLSNDDPLMISASERGSNATITDPWYDALSIILKDFKPNFFVSTGRLFSWLIADFEYHRFDCTPLPAEIPPHKALAGRKPADMTRLANVMQSLGWEKYRTKDRRGYRKL